MLKTEIEFVNHASVLIRRGETGLLSDPWYAGDAFNCGWNLLYENPERDIRDVLGRVTHLWLSHEHPDHFSIPFFRTYGDLIRDRRIQILFQQTHDKRVKSFLERQGFEVTELPFDRPVSIGADFAVTCLKDGFIDSGLLVQSAGEKILNLNDCEVTSRARADEVHRVTGNVDVLLTQFSYAAWKGGKENIRWRREAAAEKLDTVALQIERFKPRFVVPFASFVYFSNSRNVYLNDAVNRPETVQARFVEAPARIVVMKPGDRLRGEETPEQSRAIAFWAALYDGIATAPLNTFDPATPAELEEAFGQYKARILGQNSGWMMRLIRRASPVRAFLPIVVELDDIGKTYRVDMLSDRLTETDETPHLRMASASLLFLLRNSYGFDSLMVNGCFEEGQTGGFVTATKSFAIDNLNNIGIRVAPSVLLNWRIIKLSVTRLYRVARKLDA